MFYTQSGFDIRCEWGLQGVRHLDSESAVLVIVDVLSFSTCVDVVVSRGAAVLPYNRREDASVYAEQHGALLAGMRGESPYSLSPASLLTIPAGTRLVLPSPNGSTLSMAVSYAAVFAGCLRNAQAVARAAMTTGRSVTVIAAGERWSDGSLRPSLEDWVGAGAIIAHLEGSRSAEAAMAEQAFLAVRENVYAALAECSSSSELIERGHADDVALAFQLNVSAYAPHLTREPSGAAVFVQFATP